MTQGQRQGLRHFGVTARAAIFGALLLGVAGLGFAGPEADKANAPATPKVSEDQAKVIALKALPGKVTGVTIETKRGKNVYAVEIMSPTKGEKDVYVDLMTGKVLGMD